MQINVGGAIESSRVRRFTPFEEAAHSMAELARLALRHTTEFFQQSANLASAFLGLASVLALVFGLWRVGADLGWAGQFVISDGLFSHWQVWIALAIVIRFTETLMRAPVPAVEPSRPVNHRRDVAQ